MRWSCPHCGIRLAISDDKLGSSWSFSRCYQCAGFALIRHSDIIVKVDKAPPGEKVLLPEGSEEPMMSQKAMDHLALHSQAKPVIRPGTRRKRSSESQTLTPMPSAPYQIPSQFIPRVETAGISVSRKMPEPLPEIPVSNYHQKWLPIGIGIAGVMAIASGIYLYIQGQAIVHKTQATFQAEPHEGPIKPASIENVSTQSNEVTDQVYHKAMAPTRVPESSPMVVRTKNEATHIYSGPGLAYSTISQAKPDTRYIVTDWSDRWFKVLISSKNPSDGVNRNHAGWIRNDMVQVVPALPNETMPATP